MGILKTLFIFALLSVSAGEVLRLQVATYAPVNLNDVAVGFLIIYWIIFHLVKRKKVKTGVLTKALAVFAGIGILSLAINMHLLSQHEVLISFLYLLRWAAYALIYFIVLELDDKFKKKIPLLMLIPGALILILGYIQYFFYPNLKNLYYLGWDEHLYRMFSTFLDPNFAGAFFCLFIFLIVGLLEVSFKEKYRLKILFFGFLGIVAFTAVFLTYSRSAILMLAVGLLLFLILKRRFKLILVLISFTLFFIIISPRAFKTTGTNLFRKVSSEARISSARQALIVFSKNPVLGVGFNAYRFAQYRYRFTALKFDPSHAAGGTDVSLLFVLVTTGIIGFASYIYLYFKIINIAYKNLKKNITAMILLISVISLTIDSFFINSLFYVFFMMWIWILAALTEST